MKPKIRAIEPKPVEYQGQRFFHLRDPHGFTDKVMLLPVVFAPLLVLCDGTRDIGTLRTAFTLRTGIPISPQQVSEFIDGMDSALLLENGAFEQAVSKAMQEYRKSEYRKPVMAGTVYPFTRDALELAFEDLRKGLPSHNGAIQGKLTGIICPHIDYQRGGRTYAEVWLRCALLLDDIDLVIILGTDHNGGPGRITPTRQNYHTPYGVLPTDQGVVDGLVEALGEEQALAEEYHHIREHSIELASVWFHYAIGGRACPIVPLLCGSFHPYIQGKEDPGQHQGIKAAVQYLRGIMEHRRTLVIAAADFAHVGPAFGDMTPVDAMGRAAVAARDAKSLEAICAGDAGAFFEVSRKESDARHICGLPAIYLTLKMLDNVRGESMGYTQCPADEKNGSLVSIASVALYKP